MIFNTFFGNIFTKNFNDIGISRELDWPRIKKLLTIGLFASVLHLAGDLILG